MLFRKQPEWGTKHGQPAGAQVDTNALFRAYAAELGLDMGKMDAAFAANRYAAKLERDKKDGQSLGVRQTPTLFVNARRLVRLKEGDLNGPDRGRTGGIKRCAVRVEALLTTRER